MRENNNNLKEPIVTTAVVAGIVFFTPGVSLIGSSLAVIAAVRLGYKIGKKNNK